MGLITFARRIFNGRTDKQRIVDAVSEIDGPHRRHSKVSNCDHSCPNTAVSEGLYEASRKHDVDQTVIVADRRTDLEINNGSVNQSINRDEWLGGGRWGFLSHDGSFRLFKWDAATGCMAPFNLSNHL
jgi:hypothetical protein